MATPKQNIERISVDLISGLTGFDFEEENFQICETYVLSNLYYHKFLDPDPRKVKEQYNGLLEKWKIQARGDKSRRLEELLERYHSLPTFKESQGQYDIHYGLLSFLYHLSEAESCPSSLSTSSKGSQANSIPEDPKEVFDWHALLQEGEEPYRLGSESELSDWSDTSDDVKPSEVKDSTSETSLSVPSKSCQVVPTSADGTPLHKETSEAWLYERLQPEYWKHEQPLKTESSHPEANVSLRYDLALRDSGITVYEKIKLTEYQVLRECLWMLRNPCASTLFDQNNDETFAVKPLVTISSVTAGCLEQCLEKICPTFTNLRTILDFQEEVLECDYSESSHPFTYEAYASAVKNILQIFSCELMKIEEIVVAQTETFTLLDFFDRLFPWFKTIEFLRKVHCQAIEREEKLENWQKSVKLLAVLHQTVNESYQDEKFAIMLDILLKTIEPYLRIMGLWLSEGRLEDWRKEFIVYRESRSVVQSEEFWSSGFVIQPCEQFLEAQGLQFPNFLKLTLPRVVVCGKSIEILSILEKQSNYKTMDNSIRLPLYEEFIKSLKEQFPVEEDSGSGDKASPLDKSLLSFDVSGLDDTVDPYLELAFTEVIKSVNNMKTDEPAESNNFILDGYKIDPLRPLRLEESLVPLIQSFHGKACGLLLKLFRDTLELESHLTTLRRVYFMESGDLLHEFYMDLFQRFDNEPESIESISLTLALQDCISRRHTDVSDRFSVIVEQDDETAAPFEQLDNLDVIYEIQWPLSIIITQANRDTYNKVFVFLLKVKRALWALQSIDPKELRSRSVTPADSSADSFHLDAPSDEELLLEHKTKVHRLLLLRSWLYHFVGSVHGYFMSRVLHSTEIEMRQQLKECTDLDELINVHNTYTNRIYDRCFLHSSASVLREAVVKVLKICMKLQSFYKDGIENLTMHQLENFEGAYSRSHQFLASTLVSMTQKRNLPHLEGLAAALVHSCPAVV